MVTGVLRGTPTGGVSVTSTSATLMTHLLCMKSYRRRGVLNSRLSQLCRQNCIFLSETLLCCTWSRHRLNAEHSRLLIFRLLRTSREGRNEGCRVDTVPTKLNCYGCYDVRCCRRRIDNRVNAFLWYRRCITVQLYALPSSPTWRWLRGSVNPSSSTLCRWSPGSNHVPPSSIHPRRHGLLKPRRDPSATASMPACRQRRQAYADTDRELARRLVMLLIF